MSGSQAPCTLRQTVTMEGYGLHTNSPCRVVLHPVDQPVGLHIWHSPSNTTIPVAAEYVGDLSLATTLTRDGIHLGTVEHLLSALIGLEIEHALIEVNGSELPILDGSSAPWVKAIMEAGTRPLPGTRHFITITRPIDLQGPQGKWMRVSPYPGFRVRYTIDFDHPSIGRQTREMTFTPEKYLHEVSSARTFCLERDIEWMKSKGLAQGGGLENAVVFGANGPLNDALRYEDEAVRHKMLDLIGDFALLGHPLRGFVEAHAAGHAMHVSMVQAILADTTAWTLTEDTQPIKHRGLQGSRPAPPPAPGL